MASASHIANCLVQERLAACVTSNQGLASIYRWSGSVDTATEVALTIKTTAEAAPALRRRLIELHPYQIPEIITYADVDLGASYQQWIHDEVAPDTTPTIVILASGRGSNAQALLRSQGPYRVSSVVTDKRGAGVGDYALAAGVKTMTIDLTQGRTIEQCQRQIAQALHDLSPTFIVLAGFMQILRPWFVNEFSGMIVNIHPSLLPAHPGLNTHKRALAAGDKEHGCSVHIVDAGVDTGPLIAQAKVPVLPGDTPETLAARVLVREHQLYPWVVSALAGGYITLSGGRVAVTGQARSNGKDLDFIL